MPHASVPIPGAAARLEQLRHATDRRTDRQTDGSRYRLMPSTAGHNKQFDVMLARFRLMDSQLAFHIIKYATRITQKQ